MKHFVKSILLTVLVISMTKLCMGQTASISGRVISAGKPVELANVEIVEVHKKRLTDTLGHFVLDQLPAGSYKIRVTSMGFHNTVKTVSLKENEQLDLTIDLTNFQHVLNDVVVTGTLKEVKRLESPVAVEVYTPAYFKKNPTANIFEALQNVNGVRPQLNCQVCNTGDIHINGLEGPYTMVLIDGMPIVSSLSTVYGLAGIPNSLVERMEVVKGPASSLYGSEAVGGLINIITKKPQNASVFAADVFATAWGEVNTDLAFKIKVGKKATALTGINYFNFQNRVDDNGDNFTDMTLQDRISVFSEMEL